MGRQIAQREQSHKPRTHENDLSVLAEREHLQAADDAGDRLRERSVQKRAIRAQWDRALDRGADPEA